MTKKENLQNKINDKSLSLEERENHFLDLQILEIEEIEKEEKRYIKKVNFIINNLDNKNYSFKISYFLDDDNYYSDFNFFKILYKKNNKQNFKKFNIYENFLTKENNDKLFKIIEKQKTDYIDDNEESEF